MPAKKGSPEAKAWAAKMAAKKAAKQEEVQTDSTQPNEKATLNPGLGEEPQTTISQDDYADLLRQINELKQGLAPQTPQIGLRGGQLVGTFEKFSVRGDDYPDPVRRLRTEPRLKRFAFTDNYDLTWGVTISEYTTIDNIRQREPKFTLELGRKLYDEDTGDLKLDKEGNPQGYIISRLIFHEDPDAALTIAREEGIDVDTMGEREFLDEMRFIRCRKWLLDCFFPSPVEASRGKKEMVVGGTIVETYAITSESPEKIPFDEIKGRILR
jgi:hypothetical protein